MHNGIIVHTFKYLIIRKRHDTTNEMGLHVAHVEHTLPRYRVQQIIPLFHTGHESPESPRIDFFLIRGGGGGGGGFVRFH